MKKKHEARIRKVYDIAGENHNELTSILHKKSLTETEKKTINSLLGKHLQFLTACGQLIGVSE